MNDLIGLTEVQAMKQLSDAKVPYSIIFENNQTGIGESLRRAIKLPANYHFVYIAGGVVSKIMLPEPEQILDEASV